jgi:hypothetical protein
MLLPPGPEQSSLIITLCRVWAQPKELTSSNTVTADRNLGCFIIWVEAGLSIQMWSV